MGKLYISIFLILSSMVGLLAQPKTYYLPNTIVVRLNSGLKNSGHESLSDILRKTDIQTLEATPMFPGFKKTKKNIPEKYDLSTIYLVKTTGNSLLKDIKKLKDLNEVAYAHPYYLPELLEEGNDPYIYRQYSLDIIKAFEAHQITTGDTNIVIGIVDTGGDLYHEDLVENYKYNYDDPINGVDDDLDGYIDNYWGWDMGDNDNNPQSFVSHHGTRVAGLASAKSNNNKGIYSIGYNTKLLTVKIMDQKGFLSGSYQGIVYAADHGADIINCSWGSTYKTPLCDDVIAYATEYKGCLVIAAAGNAKTNEPYYPASCKNVLNVGATNVLDYKWNNSTYGIELDLVAPGEGVFTTDYNNKYSNGWGTSYAAPIVAGAAALVKDRFPEYSPLQIGEQLRITSDIVDTLPENEFYYHQMGYGRLNAQRAVSIDNLPSVRITEYNAEQTYGKLDDGVYPGDTLKVTFSALNYLAQTTSTVVRLTLPENFVSISDNTRNLGAIPTMGTAHNTASPFEFIFTKEPPFDYQLFLNFEFNDEGYSDYQLFKYVLNPSFIDIETKILSTSLTSNGAIGYANRSQKTGKGLIYNQVENVLNDGGLILARNSSETAGAAWGNLDFTVEKKVDTLTVNNEYLRGLSSYSANELTALPLKVEQETRAYYSEELSSTLIHIYRVINTGTETINNLKPAIFADFDLDYNLSNRTAFDEQNGIFYTYSTTEQVLYCGICLLENQPVTPYGFDLVSGGNGGLDITDGFSNEQKWFAMNNARPEAGNEGDSINVASMLTGPEVTLSSKDTAEVAFAIIVGDNLLDLQNQAQEARTIYEATSIKNHRESGNVEVSVYPVPAKNSVNINLESVAKGQVSLFKLTGELIGKKSFTGKSIQMNTAELINGVYVLKITTDVGTKTLKFNIEH